MECAGGLQRREITQTEMEITRLYCARLGQAELSENFSQDLVLLNIKVNVSVKTSRHPCGYELTKIESESFNYISNIGCFKISSCSMIIENPLDNQTTPVSGHIERNSAHWTGWVRSCTAEFPAIQASLMKLMSAPNLPSGTLAPHGREAYGALRTCVLPASFRTLFDYLPAIAA